MAQRRPIPAGSGDLPLIFAYSRMAEKNFFRAGVPPYFGFFRLFSFNFASQRKIFFEMAAGKGPKGLKGRKGWGLGGVPAPPYRIVERKLKLAATGKRRRLAGTASPTITGAGRFCGGRESSRRKRRGRGWRRPGRV